jgi:hypothetical protein
MTSAEGVACDVSTTEAAGASSIESSEDWRTRTFFRMRLPNTSRVRKSRSPNARGRGEKISKMPRSPSSHKRGSTATDRTPNSRETSASALGSVRASSQHCVCRVRAHVPERPEFMSSRVPSSGAVPPLVARQTMSTPRASAIAAPVAPVARQACSTISLSTISRASSPESSFGMPPPCAANCAANSAKSDSRTLCAESSSPEASDVEGAAWGS